PGSGTLTASDVDGDPLTFAIVTQGTKGTVTVNALTGAYTYTPNANANGPDSFTFKVNDGTVDSNIATVTVTITAVNDPPVANTDAATTAEDTPVTIAVLGNDTDVDGDTLSVSGVSAPSHGSVIANADGTITYTPAANYNGADAFTYTIGDGHGGTATGTVTVTIAAVNDAPVAAAGTLTTAED